MNKEHKILIDELIKLLNGGNAHATFDHAIDGLPKELRGVKPEKLPYSIWQLVDHIRIAQWDMLEFSKDGGHESPEWPSGYWAKDPEPPSDEAWDDAIAQIEKDRKAFIELLHGDKVYDRIPHGSGQSILLEALQIADHNAYHTAEIIVIRRLLDAWR
jgi:hypothetical protein